LVPHSLRHEQSPSKNMCAELQGGEPLRHRYLQTVLFLWTVSHASNTNVYSDSSVTHDRTDCTRYFQLNATLNKITSDSSHAQTELRQLKASQEIFRTSVHQLFEHAV
jgi:hypothetical protein